MEDYGELLNSTDIVASNLEKLERPYTAVLIRKQSASIRALAEERDRLRNALKPFATFVDAGWEQTLWHPIQDSAQIMYDSSRDISITYGDLCNARAALGEKL